MDKTFILKSSSITIRQYVKLVLGLYFKDWWWAYVLPVLVCLILGAFNSNFFYVAVILVFLIFSMMFSFVYIYHGLVPESRYSIKEKEIKITNDGFELIYSEVNSSGNIEERSEILKWDLFKNIFAKDEFILVMFNSRKYAFLAIPFNAFEKEDMLKESVLFVSDHLSD